MFWISFFRLVFFRRFATRISRIALTLSLEYCRKRRKSFSLSVLFVLSRRSQLICTAMALKLFYMSISPPSRAVLLTARNLGLDVDVKHVNLLAGEHLTAEFLKMSPVHQVPVLVDNDFVLCESRAIMTYLVNSKRPGSELYPTDPKQRAQIDRLLYYDATIVFERNGSVIVSRIFLLPLQFQILFLF